MCRVSDDGLVQIANSEPRSCPQRSRRVPNCRHGNPHRSRHSAHQANRALEKPRATHRTGLCFLEHRREQRPPSCGSVPTSASRPRMSGSATPFHSVSLFTMKIPIEALFLPAIRTTAMCWAQMANGAAWRQVHQVWNVRPFLPSGSRGRRARATVHCSVRGELRPCWAGFSFDGQSVLLLSPSR